MKIKLAGTLGYCMGVRRAMDMAFTQLSLGKSPVYSHGPLIHNQAALDLLEEKGLRLWSGQESGVIIIRAHGLPPGERDRLAGLGLTVVDATCPRVAGVQKLVAGEAARGRDIIIWGSADHPEVAGILGHTQGRGLVIGEAAEVATLPNLQRVTLVAQTTQNLSQYPEVARAVLERWPEAVIRSTICEATENRQRGVADLAREVDALMVVGGQTSGNTRRLAEIGRQAGLETFLVESREDLDPAWLAGREKIGLAAGASTPLWQINQVLAGLRSLSRGQTGTLAGFGSRLLRALVLSGIYPALGMASLGWAAAQLAGARPPGFLFSLWFFFMLAVSLVLCFHQRKTVKFNDPDRLAFLQKYRRPLIAFGLTAVLLTLWGALLAGPDVLALLTALSLASLVYHRVPRPPSRLSGSWLSWLKPALQALFSLAALMGPLFLCSPPPLPGGGPAARWILAAVGLYLPLLSLAITLDILGAQGDRIFGRATLPTVFGDRATARLLNLLLLLWSLALLAGWAANLLPVLIWGLLAAGPVYSRLIIKPLVHRPELSGFQAEAILYGQGLLAGLFTLLPIWR